MGGAGGSCGLQLMATSGRQLKMATSGRQLATSGRRLMATIQANYKKAPPPVLGPFLPRLQGRLAGKTDLFFT